jgi:hypothetical protein
MRGAPISANGFQDAFLQKIGRDLQSVQPRPLSGAADGASGHFKVVCDFERPAGQKSLQRFQPDADPGRDF